MDILVSSNLERLLYLLTGSDDAVRGYMQSLAQTGRYEVTPDVLAQIQQHFDCGFCGDSGTEKTIGDVFADWDYLPDTHTAVAWNVLRAWRAQSGDDGPAILVSTASPFKFCTSVLDALGVHTHRPGVQVIAQLAEVSGRPAPAPLAGLAGKAVRFTACTAKEAMTQAVLEQLS